mmetsp:Transcript_33133/g.52085  ORF Transcript_33133/g.52085 Transcript_33133/m.52085 type:complete len:113 (+) Transcript_33133:72-410(+)
MKLIQFFALASLCAPAVTLKSLRGDDQTFKSNYVDMVEETPSIRASSTSFRQGKHVSSSSWSLLHQKSLLPKPQCTAIIFHFCFFVAFPADVCPSHSAFLEGCGGHKAQSQE